MILSDLRHYLEGRPQSTLAEMALHFRADPEALRGMLEVWIRKGKVEKRLATASCGSHCGHCDPLAAEIYRWNEGRAEEIASFGPVCRR